MEAETGNDSAPSTKRQRKRTASYNDLVEGTNAGDLITADLMLKCRCYKNYDMYVDFVRSDALKYRQMSHMSTVKESLQTLKHDEITGGVVLERFDHPTEENSVIMRVLTFDGHVVAASTTNSILIQYFSEKRNNKKLEAN